MAGIVNRVTTAVSQGIGYMQHGVCYAVEKCGSAMQVGGALILGVEVSNYAKENTWWTQSATVAHLSEQTGKFSTWCEMDPRSLGVFLLVTGSVFSLAGNYGKMDVNKIRELNHEVLTLTQSITANTAAMQQNTRIRDVGNTSLQTTLGLLAQEARSLAVSGGKAGK